MVVAVNVGSFVSVQRQISNIMQQKAPKWFTNSLLVVASSNFCFIMNVNRILWPGWR